MMIPRQDRAELRLLKGFLFMIAVIFAVAATLLVIFLTSAATLTGRTPFASISLVDGLNTGILGPGEQRWFKFIPDKQRQSVRLEKSLTFIFTPGDGNRIGHVNMQIFKTDQLRFFYHGDVSKMANLGAGQIVSRDNNPETGELFWTGWVSGQQSYYVQLMNGGDTPIDYWLFTDDDIGYPLDEPEADVTGAISEEVEPTLAFAPGAGPQTAMPLHFGQNKGGLDPGEETWYSFSMTDQDGEYFEEMALTMIVTPDNGNRIRNMTFDIFTARSVQHWSPGNNSQINNIGAGSIVYRDNNPLTGERFWSGWVVDGDLYYLQIRNGADVHMDYWLFTGDVYGPELGEADAP